MLQIMTEILTETFNRSSCGVFSPPSHESEEGIVLSAGLLKKPQKTTAFCLFFMSYILKMIQDIQYFM